jgi:phosphoglycerate kinase
VSHFFGWTRDDVIGKNIAFLIQDHPPELPEAHVSVFQGRHKKDYFFPILVQPMRDPMATMVAWLITPVTIPPIFDFSFNPTTAAALSKKMTLDDVDVKGKRVLIRVDFNVPINEKGEVRHAARILATLPTINRVIKGGGKAILMSHLGRPNGKIVESMSLKPVRAKLEDMLGQPVAFAPDCLKAAEHVTKMKNGEVLLLENLRFHQAEDSKNLALRTKMAEVLAGYADIYVSDAFGTAHRESASMTGVPRVIGAGIAGYLMEKEVSAIRAVMQHPKSPVVAIIGGSKVSDKINLLGSMFDFANIIIIGGAMSFTFLEATGYGVANSKIERTATFKGREIDMVSVARDLMQQAKKKNCRVVLPLDHACVPDFKSQDEPTISKSSDVPEGMMALDIGPKTIELCQKIIAEARTVVWNGPVGVFEKKPFDQGTTLLAEAVANNEKCFSLAGGGDTAAAIKAYKDKFSHVSTGGGATLELLEGKPLPGLVCLTSRMAAAKL